MVGTPANCSPGPATVSFGRDRLTADVADDEASREQGLMGVTDLPPDSGMVFLFDGPTTTSFWMKDTLIPLSVAFIGEDGRIVAIREMKPCEADPCPTYGSDGPYVQAVEANTGWFSELGVDVGDQSRLLMAMCT